ncbi:MAG TPA: phosphotransferase [Oscillospiraceae bacterium]|nr:phosphotransferase [Oscillospiraceae bacterium]
MTEINQASLLKALSKKLNTPVQSADYTIETLNGGTLGDVAKLTGKAQTSDGKKPYTIVLKIQKKWERPGDPDSWRREYDLYQSNFGDIFTEPLRWPECYLAELNDDKIELWMEYISGDSGENLDFEALRLAAAEWGRIQGRLYAHPEKLTGIKCLSDPGRLFRNFEEWHTRTYSYEFLTSEKCRLPGFLKQLLKDGSIKLCGGKSFEYALLRSDSCDIPEHLKRMLTELDENKGEVFARLKRLPIVFCHRDFWIENIFVSDGQIRLIDWDGAGLGCLGEDIASLIFDDTETDNLHACFRVLFPAYVNAVSEYMEVPPDFYRTVTDLILITFGYRTAQKHMFTQDPETKKDQIKRLQAVHDWRS